MKRKLTTMALALTMVTAMPASFVKADSATVVTIGANLTDVQKDKMFEYFGVDESSVAVLEVTNTEEREYLEGVASEKQIGTRTFSCAYIEPTDEGNGINVKTANLNWVTSYMIKSTLATAGIYDCNVIAAAPFEVSGTGALTGIMKAFETVTGTELDEEKKELATEELVMTGELADEIGSDEATGIITEIKNNVIGNNVVVADEIEQVIIDASTKYEVTLTDEQVEMITGTMTKLAAQDYDYDRLQDTFQSITDSTAEKLGIDVQEEAEGFVEKIIEFFKSIVNWFRGLFSDTEESSDETADTTKDVGILNQTNDDILGDNVITDSTEATVAPEATVEPTVEPTEQPTEEPVVSEESETTPEVTPEVTEEAEVQEESLDDEGTLTDETALEEAQEENEQ